MNIFITGGTGFVGRNICVRLRDEGHRIRALVRPGSEEKLSFLDGVEIVFGDILKPAQWESALLGLDTIIHLVGIIREFPAQNITFENMHFDATETIVEAGKKAGVERFIHMSANGAGEHGVSVYQTTKWLAEQVVVESGMKWTIFRPSVIFGDSEGMMEFTLELARVISKAPVMPIFGDGEYMLEPIFIKDVADCFVKAVTNDEAVGKTLHLGGGEPISFYDIVQHIGKAVGKVRTKTIKVPFWLIKPVAGLLGRFKFFPVTEDQLKMLKGGNVCPEHEYQKVFGIEPIKFIYQNLGYLNKFKRRKR